VAVFPEFTRLSPNYDVTRRHERLGVCFHHSITSFDETIALMARPDSQVSYHGLIGADGTRCTLVVDGHIAWHAGASGFLGRERCNDFLLGCAFAGDTYATPLADAQIASALEWLAPRWSRHSWTIEVMADHRPDSPGPQGRPQPGRMGAPAGGDQSAVCAIKPLAFVGPALAAEPPEDRFMACRPPSLPSLRRDESGSPTLLK
jgi:AmpD protein